MLQGTVRQIKITPKFILHQKRQIFDSPIFPLIRYSPGKITPTNCITSNKLKASNFMGYQAELDEAYD